MPRSPWMLRGLTLLLAVSALFVPLRDLAHHHAFITADPARFTDDASQHLVPYFSFGRNPALRDDPAAAYYLACHPVGYRALFTAAGARDLVVPLSHHLPHLLLILTAALLAWGLWPAVGWSGALLAALLTLSCEPVFARMAGALPRAFAVPVCALALAGLLRGRDCWVITAVLLGAATYPAAAVAPGIALGLRAAVRAGRARALRPLLPVAVTGLLAAALLFPPLLATRPFGPQITGDQLEAFPEAGALGRLPPADQITYRPNVFNRLSETIPDLFTSRGTPRVPFLHAPLAVGSPAATVLNLILGMALLAGAFHRPAIRAWGHYLIAMLIAFGLATLLSPRLFLPERHLAYTLPVLGLAGVVLGLRHIADLITRLAPAARRGAVPHGIVLVIGAALLLTQGRVLAPRTGLARVPGPVLAVAPAVAGLPPDAVVAGWPRLTDGLAYLTARRVLLSHETQIPYHAAYTLAQRARMEALIEALFAEDERAIAHLRDTYGVTHLLVHPDLYPEPPLAFMPFAVRMLELRGSGAGERSAARRAPPEARIFTHPSVELIDLARWPVSDDRP